MPKQACICHKPITHVQLRCCFSALFEQVLEEVFAAVSGTDSQYSTAEGQRLTRLGAFVFVMHAVCSKLGIPPFGMK
jgi:hypothetical protein